MEINDKRKFDAEGNSIAVEEEVIEQSFQKALSDIPRVYDDPEPLTNHCLVKQHAAETTYKGTRFVIPDTAQQSPNEGVVVAVGPDIDPNALVPGDLVVFGRFNAEPISIGEDVFQLVNFHDIKLRRKVTYAIAQH